jgi:hypothetical protein
MLTPVAFAALLSFTPVSHADPLAAAPAYNHLEALQTLGPVMHSPVRDQADVGFCWSYSLSGYLEGEALKKGKKVTLSPEYLALNHLPNLMYEFLPLFETVDDAGFFTRLLVRVLVAPLISPEGSVSFSESLYDVGSIGMVPETFFAQKFPFGKGLFGQKVEIHPTLQERITKFVRAKLFTKANVQFYEKNPEAFRKDFFDGIGIHPPKPTDTFTYEGKSYTPISFMRDYLEFNPEDYQEIAVMKGEYKSLPDKLAEGGLDMSAMAKQSWPKPLSGYSQAEALAVMQKALADNTSVPVTFLVLEDQKLAEQNGVFSNANCVGGACKKSVGGHAVLATGMKIDASAAGAPVSAVVIKNSWGDIGLNDQGQVSAAAGSKGFFLIARDYFTSTETISPDNGWSILVNKRYLPAAK